MQGSIYVTHLPKFEHALRDRAMYIISAFDVTRSNTHVKLSDFHFYIRFTPATFFEEVEESFCVIPKEFFRLRTHEELVSLANTNTELPDVMGEVVSTKTNGMSQTLERMLVHLRLESGQNVRLSAFDDQATSLEKVFSKNDEGTYILLATNINPKIIADELFLNATSGTKFYSDGDLTTTQEFAERLKGRAIYTTITKHKQGKRCRHC
ncbi:PREDICTED: uncharacterized protein LOC104730825 isoform X1 [Camelina sativa]|uniref:Uncharacterized protein LOC104730825 isoform X1 n=2 Tax=Camelina sativa TaxID=90675 RepID=A0ABM1QRS0_CAMSA|nr:PREDICTED: uncharacterized protein LOC104730825 isoform X1 [Camelina sativa]